MTTAQPQRQSRSCHQARYALVVGNFSVTEIVIIVLLVAIPIGIVLVALRNR